MKHTADPNSKQNASLPQISDKAVPTADPVTPTSGNAKEWEPRGGEPASFAEESKLVAQIESTSEAIDQKALEAVERELSGVKASYPQPTIPPDLEDAGVIDPTQEANKVLEEGPTMDLPLSENKYKEGLKTPAKGKWYYTEREVVGVRSIVAMALWVKRLIGRAHRHAMRVVFRKGGDK